MKHGLPADVPSIRALTNSTSVTARTQLRISVKPGLSLIPYTYPPAIFWNRWVLDKKYELGQTFCICTYYFPSGKFTYPTSILLNLKTPAYFTCSKWHLPALGSRSWSPQQNQPCYYLVSPSIDIGANDTAGGRAFAQHTHKALGSILSTTQGGNKFKKTKTLNIDPYTFQGFLACDLIIPAF